MTTNGAKTQIDENVLAAILDRLVPTIEDLPPAGQMGLTPEVVRLAGKQDRFWGLFAGAMESFTAKNPSFVALDGEAQDRAIRSFESGSPEFFGALLSICYIVYYKDPRVHGRLGWDGKPPQPDGQEMEPWDDSVLENIRKREPFWRRV